LSRRISQFEKFKQIWIYHGHDKTNQARDHTDSDTDHKEDIIGQIVRNNDRPSLVLKELNHVLASIEIVESIQTNIDVSPLILEYTRRKLQRKTQKDGE
jgi:hypothetical protein